MPVSRVPRFASTHFGVFRILFGAYLTVYFVRLSLWSKPLLSDQGLPAALDGASSTGLAINILEHFDSLRFVSSFLGLLALLSTLLALGIGRRWVACAIFYGWLCVIHKNLLMTNVSVDYLGWMLLVCMATPGKEAFRWRALALVGADVDWTMPRILRFGAWTIFAVGYSVSGYVKYGNAYWRSGEALELIVGSPLGACNVVTSTLLDFPMLMKCLTWFTLFLELFCVVLCLNSRLRLFTWVALSGMHLGIYITTAFQDIPIAMLLFHLLVFDVSWFHKTSS